MLMPKRVKRRRVHRGRMKGKKIAEEYSDGKLTPELVKLLKHKEMAAL